MKNVAKMAYSKELYLEGCFGGKTVNVMRLEQTDVIPPTLDGAIAS